MPLQAPPALVHLSQAEFVERREAYISTLLDDIAPMGGTLINRHLLGQALRSAWNASERLARATARPGFDASPPNF